MRIENRSHSRASTSAATATSVRSKQTLQLNLPDATREALAHLFEGKRTLLSDAWDGILPLMPSWFALPTQASKEPLTRHYCSTVQGNTLSGCQTPRTSAAAVVRLDDAYCALNMKENPGAETVPAIALVAGCQERWIEIDPLNGSAQSTLLLARRIAASGARPLAMTDCLNFGSPRQPAVMRQISDAIDGINSVAKTMHIPIVSGNVSLNNQTGNIPIPPTPMVGMVGVVDKANDMVEDSHPLDSKLFWLRSQNMEKLTSFEYSEWAWNVFKHNAGPVPDVDFVHEQNLWSSLAELRSTQVLSACSCVGVGGMLATVMTLSARNGSAFAWSPRAMGLSLHECCAEGQAGVLVTLRNTPQAERRLEASVEKHKLEAIELGCFVKSSLLKPEQQSTWGHIQRSYADSLKPFFE